MPVCVPSLTLPFTLPLLFLLLSLPPLRVFEQLQHTGQHLRPHHNVFALAQLRSATRTPLPGDSCPSGGGSNSAALLTIIVPPYVRCDAAVPMGQLAVITPPVDEACPKC